MRNDARPIGEDSPASPVGGHDPNERERPAAPDRGDRQSHAVNREAPERQRDAPEDPVMPSSDSSVRTKM